MSADDHGNASTYTRCACRCADCSDAMALYHGHHPQSSCIQPLGKNSRCGVIAARLIEAEAIFRRLARMANRSESHFRKYRDELDSARKFRDEQRKNRDEHMTECPGAAERFAS